MKALATVSIAVLFLAAGCSSPAFYWYHPGRTIDEAKADYAECRDQARQKAADVISDQHYDRLPPPDGSSAARNLREPDKTARNPREIQDAWRERYAESVVADCMREKGYMMLKPDHIPRGVHTRKLSQGGVAGR
jgi:hypothetical protein